MVYNTQNYWVGCTTAQTVSRRLPTAAARVRAQERSCGICGGQSSAGLDFLRVLRFPLPILIQPTAPRSSSIIRGWYNRPISAQVPSGLSLTPTEETVDFTIPTQAHFRYRYLSSSASIRTYLPTYKTIEERALSYSCENTQYVDKHT
jgi:hypothetical protein